MDAEKLLAKHPRAAKLMRQEKNFIVIAEHEPYFIFVYSLIRENERHNGTWTGVDEELYRNAEMRYYDRLRKQTKSEED